jgi:hypothetical protein
MSVAGATGKGGSEADGTYANNSWTEHWGDFHIAEAEGYGRVLQVHGLRDPYVVNVQITSEG